MSTPNFLGASGTTTANDRLNALLQNLTGGNKNAGLADAPSNDRGGGSVMIGRRGGGFDQSALSGDKFDRMFGAVVHPSVIAEQKKREKEAQKLAGVTPTEDAPKKKVNTPAAAGRAAISASTTPTTSAVAASGSAKDDSESGVAARPDWRALNRAKKEGTATPATTKTVAGDAASKKPTSSSSATAETTAAVAEPTAAEALKMKLVAQQKERSEAIDHVKHGATAASRAREEAEARLMLVKYPPPPVETPEDIKQIIHPALHRAVFDKLKLTSLTKVQQLSWGPMTDGKGGDVLIRSETGSGKTLAYALPLIHSLITQSFGKNVFPAPPGTPRITHKVTRENGTYAIILCPTRELADQVSSVVQILVTFNPNIVVGAIHGGENRHKEKARIRKGITVLVATPGRMLDHLRTTEIFLGNDSTNGENRVSHLQTLVLDEADRLLDMGFENTMREICSMVQFSQKRVLVSATITNDVQRLAHFALKQPILKVGSLLGDDSFEVPRGLRQHYTIVPPKQRLAALLGFLRSQIDAGSRKIVVFVSTSDSAEFHYLLLSRLQNPYKDVGALLGRKGAAKFRNQQYGVKRGRDEDAVENAGPKKGHKKILAKANAHIGFGDDDTFEELEGADNSAANERGFVGLNGQNYSHISGEKSGFQMEEGELDGFINVNVFKLHGNMTQVDRASVFHSFKHVGEKPAEKKNKKRNTAEDDDADSVDSDDEVADAANKAKAKPVNNQAILFCTDVAARGLDMPHIDWIVHYDPPADERCYVHRVGRTARIGRGGDSILFFHEHEEGFAKFLLSSLLKYKENQHTDHATVGAVSGSDKVITAAEALTAQGTAPAAVPNTNMAIQFKKSESYLFYLTKLDPACNHHWVQAAANLQRAISICVKNDTALNRTAMFAYLSYLRAYNGFPKAVKQYFDARLLHLGHIAASFGITAKPSEIRAQLQANHGVDDELKLSRDTTQFRDHRRMEDIHKAPDTSAIGFGDEGGGGSGGRFKPPHTAHAAASGYHSTLVSKQLQKTRDYHEIQKEKRKAIPKPFQFSEFDA